MSNRSYMHVRDHPCFKISGQATTNQIKVHIKIIDNLAFADKGTLEVMQYRTKYDD
uniref:Uncharacterized protein n=1 Tax=Picea glauca TaxID=3330 RepID=A0A117NH99_PICGL|nr:hypothetical protein ABT39_MTgene5048 [Picea glauca]